MNLQLVALMAQYESGAVLASSWLKKCGKGGAMTSLGVQQEEK
jgi:hypothetical protein